MCIFDHNGNFVQVKTMCYSPLLSVKEGEALGLLQAIRWIGNMGMDNVIFELDAKVVVNCFNISLPMIFLSLILLLKIVLVVLIVFVQTRWLSFLGGKLM
jgi:hypothetical protein